MPGGSRVSARRKLALAAIIALGLLASYGLALAGEPQSRWFWGWAL
jgi:hypothetical protein